VLVQRQTYTVLEAAKVLGIGRGAAYEAARTGKLPTLRGSALKVLIELRCRFRGFNNGKVTLSMDEAARLLGLSKGTINRALAELQEKGFIKLQRRGQWYGRRANEWVLTMCSLKGLPATNDWRLWKAPKPLREARKNNSRYQNDPIDIVDGVV
jgi:DNA-binding transcriptional ArsR family regulator